MNRIQTLLIILLVTVPLVVAGAGVAAFLLMRAGFGFLVWGVLPFLASLLAVAAISFLLSRAARPGGGGDEPPEGRRRMVYSPLPMEDHGREQEDLEAKVGELEQLADSLNEVPDEELVETLGEAVELLGEINARIEDRLDAAGEESREIGDLLGGVDFGPFDEALEEHEAGERATGEPGV